MACLPQLLLCNCKRLSTLKQALSPVLYSMANDVKRPLPPIRNTQSLHFQSFAYLPDMYLHAKFRYDPALISWCSNFFVHECNLLKLCIALLDDLTSST
ncbi:hypothetical protein TNCV_3631521 [Trichonephila clavipes]|nr:hypothetical protein TNCV_3631521 [Trichonephila clavipes]